MNTTTASLVPPFSATAARRRAFRAVLRRTARAMWRGLVQSGQRRAERELADFVQLHGDRYPELADRVAPTRRAVRHPAA